MLCTEYCYKTIVDDLKKTPGVQEVTLVDFDEGIIKVEYTGGSSSSHRDAQVLIGRVETLGYEAAVEGDEEGGPSSSGKQHQQQQPMVVVVEIEGMTW